MSRGCHPGKINQNYLLHIFVTTNNNKNINKKIIRTFNFKLENVSFTKLLKNILMVTHVTNKVIINVK